MESLGWFLFRGLSWRKSDRRTNYQTILKTGLFLNPQDGEPTTSIRRWVWVTAVYAHFFLYLLFVAMKNVALFNAYEHRY